METSEAREVRRTRALTPAERARYEPLIKKPGTAAIYWMFRKDEPEVRLVPSRGNGSGRGGAKRGTEAKDNRPALRKRRLASGAATVDRRSSSQKTTAVDSNDVWVVFMCHCYRAQLTE